MHVVLELVGLYWSGGQGHFGWLSTGMLSRVEMQMESDPKDLLRKRSLRSRIPNDSLLEGSSN